MIRIACFLVFALCAPPLVAQDTPHTGIQPGLVYLEASGTPGKEEHPQRGVPGGVVSQGTGFFVGTDGFILTTLHFLKPLEDAEARQISITASIGGASSGEIQVLVASELKRVDLLLLKANMPFDMPPPKPLTVGRISTFDRDNPARLFTSGFHGTNFRQKEVEFNRSENGDFPYAWEINVKTNSGQSGSPVYDKDGNVLGVIKGTHRTDDELTLMIPIDFAMPLIGHLEIDRLNDRVELLLDIIGEMTRDDPPLHERLLGIEENMTELSNRFTWSADASPEGDLIVRYEKLIGGGSQVENVRVHVVPSVRKITPGGAIVERSSPLKLGTGTGGLVEEKILDADERVGEFIIPGLREKLGLMTELFGDIYIQDPFRDLEVTIIPVVDGNTLNTRKLTVIPTYEWDNQ